MAAGLQVLFEKQRQAAQQFVASAAAVPEIDLRQIVCADEQQRS